jgi:integrase
MPGSGSVYKITDAKGRTRWIAQMSIGTRTHRRFVKRTRDSEREARAALRELVDERERVTSPTRATLSAFLDRWVADVRNIRPRTRVEYANAIRLHISPLIGNIRLATLLPLHVEAMLASLERTVAPKTARNIHAVLRRALRDAVRSGLVPRNVAAREYVDAPRVRASEPRALSIAELRRLLDAARGDWLEGLIVVAVGTGLRQGELLGLAWEDVELGASPVESGAGLTRRAQLHVRHALRREPGPTRRAGRYLRDDLKTERSRRTVPLTPAVATALVEHRERVIAAGFVPTATGPVFPSVRGRPLSSGWVTHRFYALCEAAGIARAPFKVLRATFASRLYEAGVPELEVGRLLGHTRTYTARSHYIGLGETPPLVIESIEAMVG